MSKNKRFFLRPIEREDIPLIKSWRNSDLVLPYVREYRLLSLAQIEKWYNTMIDSDKFEMFVMSDNDTPIGICGMTYINWQNRHADLHFAIYNNFEWIDEVYAPKFYEIISKYAFEDLNLNKIYVEVYEHDNKKIKFFKNNGFRQDARLRQHYFHKGEYLDSLILSLLRSER